jgi:hypothetical protein
MRWRCRRTVSVDQSHERRSSGQSFLEDGSSIARMYSDTPRDGGRSRPRTLCRDLRNSTAEQPAFEAESFPISSSRSGALASPVEIEETGWKVLEVLTPESEHWRGLQRDPTDRLLIRRSLVRAQVEEPMKSKGYVVIRNPFLFAILESGRQSARVRPHPSRLRERPRGHQLSATNPPPGALPRRRVRSQADRDAISAEHRCTPTFG